MTKSAAADAYYEADREVARLEGERGRIETARRREFDKTLRSELDTLFAAPLKTAREARAVAREARDAAIVAEALAETHPVPLGTLMEEWKAPASAFRQPARRTGRMGVVEVVTPESEHPDNRQYSRASLGSLVIRLLKKDRTPGKGYVYFPRHSDEWRPAEQTPGVNP